MDKQISELICQKDESKALYAAKELIDKCDIKEFEKLCKKTDYLFDFVKDNVCKRIEKAVNKDNFRNIIKFFNFYSPCFDEVFSSVLAKYANEDLTDDILEILSKGNESQKTYAASYFKKIPDTVAKEDLINNLSLECEPLFENCAAALGVMKDTESYEKYLKDLKSEDDFVKLRAVKFLIAYGNKTVLKNLIDAMKNSSMSENIAGEITNLFSPSEIIKLDFENGALLYNNIVNGLGEILPLENIFYYEIYELLENLFLNANRPESALILFNLKDKFDMLTQNEEYIFDLDKNIKDEIFTVKNKLFSKNNEFWEKEKDLLLSLINENSPYLHDVLEVISDNRFMDFTYEIVKLTRSGNEITAFEAANTLKRLGELQKIDKNLTFKNNNLKAAFEQMFT